MMMIFSMIFLSKSTLFKVLFFIYYSGDNMQIDFNNINNNIKIIDIRSSLEFEKYNILGSINIPRMILLKSPDNYLNKNEEYYLICNKGEVSLSCARILNALGYKCYSIKGGVEGLKK